MRTRESKRASAVMGRSNWTHALALAATLALAVGAIGILLFAM
jgi:hypothetical protein